MTENVITTPLVFRETGVSGKRTKVRLLPAGRMVYRGQEIEFTEDDLKMIASETRRLIANCKAYAGGDGERKPWTPPVIREHESNGTRDGDVLSVDVQSGELFATCDWKDSTWEAILAEEVEYVSVRIEGPYTDMAGETYERVVWEVSLTTHPVRKDIGRIQDTLTLALSDGRNIPVEPGTEAIMEELVNELVARLDSLESRLTAMEEASMADAPEDAPTEEAPAEASDTPEEDVALSEVAGRLERIERAIVKLSEGRPGLPTRESGNGGPIPAPAPRTIAEKQAAAKAKGLSGVEALAAALK